MEWLKNVNIDKTERPLFDLEAYPCFDPNAALSHLNHNKALLIMMLQEFFLQEMPEEKQKLNTAFATQDWDKIEKLTHKIMGGIMYLGLLKMQYACQHLERYYHTEQTRLLPALYQQFMQSFDDTQHAIQQWLDLEKNPENEENTNA
ncbi:MAG: Hpt domain-containing protein [Gammaproteobacteria bacterium]|jgi:HPt (histidine-containing phosphotransfer) domain-containing protein|nr:Hpt domain-containing protein [Gammaproteobacteria bacterium]